MVSQPRDPHNKKFAWHNDDRLNRATSNTRRILSNDRARMNKAEAAKEKRFKSGRRGSV